MATARFEFHPGHGWNLLSAGDAQSDMNALLIACPKAKLFVKRYNWRDLEGPQGTFHLTEMTSDCNFLKSKGARLLPMVVGKTFTHEDDRQVLPDPNDNYAVPNYLIPYSVAGPVGAGGTDQNGGYSLKVYDPFVVGRYKVLLSRIATAVGKNDGFEGVAIQESALGIDVDDLNADGYTAAAYAESIVGIIQHAATVFAPTSTLLGRRIFWNVNYIAKDAYTQPLIDYVVNKVRALKNLVLTGPDNWPYSKQLNERTYPHWDEWRTNIPLGITNSRESYQQSDTTGLITMQELFTYARDRLHVNYLFWTAPKTPAINIIQMNPIIYPAPVGGFLY